MAILISGTTISEAWLSGLEALAERDGVAINLCVAIADPHQEDLGIRSLLDTFLQDHTRCLRTVETVANTIFPQSLYRGVGTEAREHSNHRIPVPESHQSYA